MVRKIRNVTLESRNARLKLKQDKKPTFVSIGQGLSVGYRRNKTAGTWVFRKADGVTAGVIPRFFGGTSWQRAAAHES